MCILSPPRCCDYLERLFALLQTDRVRVVGAAAHRELDVDVETVGMTTVDVRRSQPVVDRRDGHVADDVHSVDVATRRRVTRFSPLHTHTVRQHSFIVVVICTAI